MSSKKAKPAAEAGPKRIKGAAVPSNSRDLIHTGPKQVQESTRRHGGKRDENGDKPTTARALVIRNGNYGARGTGELAVVTKITGREKLDLLAEDLVEQAKVAVVRPFNLDHCIKIADSQLDSSLDDISNLQDTELFFELIKKEVAARIPAASKTKKNAPDLSKDPAFVASVIASRVHNAYMLSSAWQLVRNSLRELYNDGLRSQSARTQLKEDDMLRERYMVLYDMVNILVNTTQSKFAVLATTTPHYARFFKNGGSQVGPDEVLFDWTDVREACKSFIDSIIIELCFPDGRYPKQTLYDLLHDAVDESPKDAKRFPQGLWDAVGDLSCTVELLDLLERPLAGDEGAVWKEEQRQMPDEYEDWVDAQIMSEKASAEVENYKNVVNPLERTGNRIVLGNMWKYININYEVATGKDIGQLWSLKEALQRKPNWHSHYVPPDKLQEQADDYDSDSPPGPVPFAKGGNKKKKLLALTDGKDEDSNDSMPDLQSVSNSSDEEESEEDDDDDDGEEKYESESDSAYDTDEEDELRAWQREAMETAGLDPDFYNPRKQANEFSAFAEERKGNPFLKLLGSLRGRMFSSKPTLSARERDEPKKPFKGTKPSKTKTKLSTHYEDVLTPPLVPKAAQPKGTRTTVEDVDDEEDAPKKKKKKPKKKKKKKAAGAGAGDAADAEGEEDDGEDEDEPVVSSSPVVSPPPSVASPPTSPAPKKTPIKKAALPPRTSSIGSGTTAAHHSTTSLLPVEQTVAESARKYLQEEGLNKPKEKIKSRPDPSMTSLVSEKEKKSMVHKHKKFNPLGREKELTEAEQKKNKFSWFSKLGKKTAVSMHQLLGTAQDDTKGIASMKWETFVKIMREMGFEYDPSTAGSSVRFDPPDKRDHPITFHKPHPDTNIDPIMLKKFAKKLKRAYGWTEDDFLKHARS